MRNLPGFVLAERIICIAVVCFLSLSAFAQQRKVAGRVINSANGQPVEAATITAKASGAATLTDAHGTFTLMVPSNEKVLIVSSIGYEAQEMVIGANSEDMSVSLAT